MASGGSAPVVSLIGNRSALVSGRPLSSLMSRGASMVRLARSGNGAVKRTDSTGASGGWSGSKVGARGPEGVFRTMCSATLRGIGAVKVTVIGRSGVQGASARSRSQVKPAAKASRTV
ncbi:hypothetical protein D3C86_1389650 [compost metagenome]